MNDTLQKFTRSRLKQKLAKCTTEEQRRFKQMYSHHNLDADINRVVNGMPIAKLDWAMAQVTTTLNHRK